MYPNLRAEMSRSNVSLADVSAVIHKNDKTTRGKLRGATAFTFPEAVAIRDTFFPACELEYLFSTNGGN